MSPEPVTFYFRQQLVDVRPRHSTQSVLDWLRTDAAHMGSKEGCNEGDCGACAVLMASLAEPGEPLAVRGLRLRPVNACLLPLASLHGQALFTVEDLPQPPLESGCAPALHPVQDAMVACHGSQCGFCTPGIVVSLYARYEQALASSTPVRPSRQELADDLSGNLCRCTGYRPILDAGEAMFEAPALRLATEPVIEALKRIAPRPAAIELQAGPKPPSPASPAQVLTPSSLTELAAARLAHPEATLIAGNTDTGLWVSKQHRDLGTIIHLPRTAELQTIERKDGLLRLGAGVTVEEAFAELTTHWPELKELGRRFASPLVRHSATLAGNVANGSPIGDGPPVLMALGATLHLRRGNATRQLPLDGFYLGYMRKQLEPGEFIEAIELPLPQHPDQLPLVRAYKISKRFDCDISSVCLAAALRLNDAGELIGLRLAWGGMAAVVLRTRATEAAGLGKPWTQATLAAMQAALAAELTPMSDLRSSAAYRMGVAQGLLERLWLETRPPSAGPALTEQLTSVWSAASGEASNALIEGPSA